MGDHDSDRRLPPGRHGLDPEFVAADQRERLLGAGTAVFSECGYAATTSRLVVRRATVSASVFYARFDDVGDLLRACFERAAKSLLEVLQSQCFEPAAPGSIASAVEAMVDFAAAEPSSANLLGVELVVADVEVARRRDGLVERLGAMLGEAADPAPGPGPASTVTELLVAAGLALVVERTATGGTVPPSGLGSELAQLLMHLVG